MPPGGEKSRMVPILVLSRDQSLFRLISGAGRFCPTLAPALGLAALARRTQLETPSPAERLIPDAPAVVARPRPALVVHNPNIVRPTRAPAGEVSDQAHPDPLKPARGFTAGIALAIAFWLVVGLAIWTLTRR
jgi:hypothetical protein